MRMYRGQTTNLHLALCPANTRAAVVLVGELAVPIDVNPFSIKGWYESSRRGVDNILLFPKTFCPPRWQRRITFATPRTRPRSGGLCVRYLGPTATWWERRSAVSATNRFPPPTPTPNYPRGGGAAGLCAGNGSRPSAIPCRQRGIALTPRPNLQSPRPISPISLSLS